jgi:hypothetical protein
MRLIISGSSFLLPKNKYWGSLDKKFNLEFLNYGDWSGALINSNSEDIISLILFLEDMIDCNDKSENEIKLFLESFLNLLVSRLSKSKSPTLVFFSSGDSDHLFFKAKNLSKNDRINFWLMEKLSILSEKYEILYFFDINKIFLKAGLENCLDQRNWYMVHSRLSATGLKQIVAIVERILNRHKY